MDKPESIKQIEEILASGYCVTIEDQEEVDAYWGYLSYRVERALFEVCQENTELTGMSWRDFRLIMRYRKRIREAAIKVLCQTIDQFSLESPCASSEIEFFRPCERADADGDIFHTVKLASSEKGRSLVEILLLRVEIACYQNQIYRGADYSWENIVNELLLGQQRWDMLRHTFQSILTRLDFKSTWQAVGIDVFLEAVNELYENAED